MSGFYLQDGDYIRLEGMSCEERKEVQEFLEDNECSFLLDEPATFEFNAFARYNGAWYCVQTGLQKNGTLKRDRTDDVLNAMADDLKKKAKIYEEIIMNKVDAEIHFENGDYVLLDGMSDQEKKEVQDFLGSIGGVFRFQEPVVYDFDLFVLFESNWCRTSSRIGLDDTMLFTRDRTSDVLSAMKDVKGYKYKLKDQRLRDTTGTLYVTDHWFIFDGEHHTEVCKWRFEVSDFPEYEVSVDVTPIKPVVDPAIKQRISELEQELKALKDSL